MSHEIVWKKEYEIGIYEIDAEHRIFLRTIQKIDEAFMQELDKTYISLLIEELYKYADFHFTSEENIMIKTHFPYYESHKKEHKTLLYNLAEIINSFPIYYDHRELVNFLLTWFKEHTTKSDTKLGDYLKLK